MRLDLTRDDHEVLRRIYEHDPAARAALVAGTACVAAQPRGVDYLVWLTQRELARVASGPARTFEEKRALASLVAVLSQPYLADAHDAVVSPAPSPSEVRRELKVLVDRWHAGHASGPDFDTQLAFDTSEVVFEVADAVWVGSATIAEVRARCRELAAAFSLTAREASSLAPRTTVYVERMQAIASGLTAAVGPCTGVAPEQSSLPGLWSVLREHARVPHDLGLAYLVNGHRLMHAGAHLARYVTDDIARIRRLLRDGLLLVDVAVAIGLDRTDDWLAQARHSGGLASQILARIAELEASARAAAA